MRQTQRDKAMNIINIVLGLPILIYSAILHEIAHGLVADRLGDPTARLSGRLTLNPIKHIDLYMSIFLPAMLILSGSPIIFGGAKPVPIDPFNLREGRKDVALVALAGPATNALLAVIASVLLHILPDLGLLTLIITIIADYNILLAIFNLLPIPPLDGSKIFALILPEREAQAYLAIGSIGTFILLFLLLFPLGGFSLSTLINTLFVFTKNLLGI